MSIKKQLFGSMGILAITFGVLLMLGLIGRYEATKRSGPEESQRAIFEKLDGEVGEAVERLKRMPVLFKERVQPLDTLARSTIREYTGSREIYGADCTLVFCSIAFDKNFDWDAIPFFLVSHGVNKELIGMDSGSKLATMNQIMESKDFWGAYEDKRKLWSNKFSKAPKVDRELFVLARQTSDAKRQFVDAFKLVPPTEEQELSEKPGRNDWHLVDNALAAGHKPEDAQRIKTAFAKLKKSWQARSNKDIIAAVDEIEASIKAMAPHLALGSEAIEDELTFNEKKPFTQASFLFALASALAVFGLAFRQKWLRILAIIASLVGLAFCVWGFYMRITLGFMIAITNLYESMVAVGCLSVLLFLIIDLVRGTSWGVAFGGLTGFAVLQIVDLNSVKFDDGISGPMAVLANNIWIHIHVPIVMSAYAFYAVAFLMSLVALPWILLSNKATNDEDLKGMLGMSDISVNLGSIFMLAGLVLGGVWAQVSWGRFWGWDPKETWGLILFLWFLVIVHGRFTKRINAFWNAWLIFFGGNVLLWTYYGTNELLSGLHSYANSAGGGGFIDNFVHEKNRWFVWTSGTMLAISIGTALAYKLMPKNSGEAPQDPAAEASA